MSSSRVCFTKIEDHNYVSSLIFFTITLQVTSTNNVILRNSVGYFQNRNPSQTFLVGINLISKIYKNLSLMESRFDKNAKLQPTTLYFSRCHHRCSHEDVLELLHWKLWKISTKMYAVEFPFNQIVRLHFAAYYHVKKSTIDAFLGVLRKERIF